MSQYDAVVIGSGPGGYVCAIRLAQLGFKTAIVEKYKTLGGTCLNVGCIPSKALLDSSERYFQMVHQFEDHGIKVEKSKLDFKKMVERVKKVVSDTCGGIDYLMKKNKIDVHHGHGSFLDPHTLQVGDQKISSKNFILATGSKPSSLPGIEIDKKKIITSTEALYLQKLPKKMLLIGGGVIGLELGSVYSRLGVEVEVIEFAPSLIPMMDADLGKTLQKCLKKEGMNFHLQHAVKSAQVKGQKVILEVEDLKKKEVVQFEGDICLVAVGRKPYTEGLGLDKAGVELDERGRIQTNDHLQTNVSHIYAIGDVTKGSMLAHKAEEEGVFVAEALAGQKPHINYNLIPGVVYTWPEIASVGATEKELKDQGVNFKKGSFPFKASGRARASNESEGFIKVLTDAATDEILGVHMIGPRAADMIAEAVIAMEFKAAAEDIARSCHPHPTYTESFKEACLAACGDRALHI